MVISRIFLKNIRKYEEKSLNLDIEDTKEQQVFITGPNGSGKTTIVESIIYPFRGFTYGSSPQKFIRKGAKSGLISLRTENFASKKGENGVKHDISAEINLSDDSNLYLDGKLTTRENLRKLCDVFWFFPQDIELILGGDEVRRNYIDSVIKYVDPSYRKIYSEFTQALRARNELLNNSTSKEAVYKSAELDAVEEVISSISVKILEKRKEITAELRKNLESLIEKFGLDYAISIEYHLSFKVETDERSSLLESLFVSRGTDFVNGSTSVGPHRDKVSVSFKGRDARYEASYGERKLLSLMLKVAGYETVKRRTGKPVIFVADDLLSELDIIRQRQAVEILQITCSPLFITATELSEKFLTDFSLRELKLNAS